MRLKIFDRDADFDQLALATANPETLMKAIGGASWSRDNVKSRLVSGAEIAFNLFYNYEQADIPFKELELIQFVSHPNFHWGARMHISPLGLFAPRLYEKFTVRSVPLISHIGIHCSEREGEEWREHFLARGIKPVFEDMSYRHTNPAIAGKRTYHNIIFGSREAIGFDFKACIRINHDAQ